MKKIVIASDSFKESLTSLEVGTTIKDVFEKQFPTTEFAVYALSDGGEGFVETMCDAMNAELVKVDVLGPLLESITATYAIKEDIAIIEMAQASGLDKLPESKKNPMITSTYGTGQLIMNALSRGAKSILLGIGGSATNDGGMGMVEALGVQFYDQQGNLIKGQGSNLEHVNRIDTSHCEPRLKEVVFKVACDVNHPLIGNDGATHIFGPQKGANKEMIEVLEKGMVHYGSFLEVLTNQSICLVPGMGAAGGLCASLYLFSKPALMPGIDLVIKTLNLEEDIKDASLVITGEGCINHQTAHGKVPVGVASIAKKYDLPVIAFTGVLGTGYEEVYAHGIDVVVPIVSRISSLQEALDEAKINLTQASRMIASTLAIKNK